MIFITILSKGLKIDGGWGLYHIANNVHIAFILFNGVLLYNMVEVYHLLAENVAQSLVMDQTDKTSHLFRIRLF